MYDLVVWSNKEHVELQAVYPKLENLSLPKNYKLPTWFTGKAQPLNTGIIYFKNANKALEYNDQNGEYYNVLQGRLNYGEIYAVNSVEEYEAIVLDAIETCAISIIIPNKIIPPRTPATI